MSRNTRCLVVDVNTFFGKRVDPDERYTPAALGAELDRHAVAVALTYSQQGVDYNPIGGNTETIALALSDRRFLPVATFNPRDLTGARAEVARCLQAGARVFRFFPGAQAWPIEALAARDLLALLRGRADCVILSAVELGAWSQIRAAAEVTAGLGVPLLLTEAHYSNMAEVIAVMRQHPHVYADTSMLATVGAVDVMAEQVGVSRLLYGSAGPWHSMQKALNQVLEADLTPREKADILGGNAMRLLGLPPRRFVRRPALPSLDPATFKGPVIDVHSHLGYWSLPHRHEHYDPAGMLRRMRRFHIARSIVSSYESMRYDIRAGNRAIAEAIRGHPELRGYVELDPYHLELSCAELDRYYRSPRFAGCEVELTHIPCPTASPLVQRLIAEVARRGRPILFMAHAPGDADIERRLARDNPGLALIHAHGFDAEWARAVRDTPNIYVEYCYSRASHQRIREGIDILGPERVLFGTDQTLLSVGAEVGMYMDARLTPTEQRLILYENARRIFHL